MKPEATMKSPWWYVDVLRERTTKIERHPRGKVSLATLLANESALRRLRESIDPPSSSPTSPSSTPQPKPTVSQPKLDLLTRIERSDLNLQSYLIIPIRFTKGRLGALILLVQAFYLNGQGLKLEPLA
ncbi:hypothetical protein V1477_018275 [Vespula maculifrons]|uniref:Uncharacterized protein n=1 Tax=Vespula maculifrons TaxID=7453 RepID=A0ABD2AYZ5_VESMC